MVGHVHLHATLLVGQGHDRAHVVLRHVQMHRHDGLAHLVEPALVGHLRRVFHHAHFAVRLHHLVDHTGGRGDQVLVKLALQALLHDLHVQEAEETTTKAEAQCLRHLGFVVQRSIVELEFFQAVTQAFVLVGLGGVEPGKHLRLDFLEAGQGLSGRQRRAARTGFDQGNGVANFGRLQLANAGDDVADLTGLQRWARLVGRGKDTQVVGVVSGTCSHQLDALAAGQPAIDHAHQHHHADVAVKPAVDDHGAQGTARMTLGRRYAGHHRFENVLNTHAGLGRTGNGIRGIDADHVLDLELGVLRIGVGQVHLVEHRHHLDAKVERGVAVGHGLRFDALAGIDHQQRTLASRQRATDLIREVNMARRVDQIEVVGLSIAGLVVQRGGLCLDGYPTLFLNVHRVQHLSFHLTLLQAATALDQPVGQG